MITNRATYNESRDKMGTNLVNYIALMGQAQQLIEALAEFVDDHGGVSPDRVGAAHVDNMTEVVRSLRRAASFAGVYTGQEPKP